jgi:non-specific serine/threonine protein kinase/serine/threonine-protein kinase
MGEVWLAEQSAPVKRQVALKIIKAGRYDKSALIRFDLERQALAMMDHPAIAKVFDAGSTAEGQPYFAMEHVVGLPVTEYCDEKRLSPSERLLIFTMVCEGVQHAHQKAIIHRDLKPTNIWWRKWMAGHCRALSTSDWPKRSSSNRRAAGRW